MGAWIETLRLLNTPQLISVAPCVGAWIETDLFLTCTHSKIVAPCVGAWIETSVAAIFIRAQYSRTLRGCVD